MYLRILGLKIGMKPKIKTNLKIFQKIQKTAPILWKIAHPFSAAYSPTEYYLQRESSPLQVTYRENPLLCKLCGAAR